MVRVIAFYRWRAGATFDHDYYGSQYMPMVRQWLMPHGLLALECDRYLAAVPCEDGEIIAATNAYFSSVDTAKAALKAVGGMLQSHVTRYTNLQPEIRLALVSRFGAAAAFGPRPDEVTGRTVPPT